MSYRSRFKQGSHYLSCNNKTSNNFYINLFLPLYRIQIFSYKSNQVEFLTTLHIAYFLPHIQMHVLFQTSLSIFLVCKFEILILRVHFAEQLRSTWQIQELCMNQALNLNQGMTHISLFIMA